MEIIINDGPDTDFNMDILVKHIKEIAWGETIQFIVDRGSNKYCSVTKNILFSTYIFSGIGSKKILRYFIKNTYNDPEYMYEKIIQILDKKSNRRYLPIKCWETFWIAYNTEIITNRFIFEIIRYDQPCKPYLDIEWKPNNEKNLLSKWKLTDSVNTLDTNTFDARKLNYSFFINKLRKDIKYIFIHRYNILLPNDSIMIATSHSIEKASFHIIIDMIQDNQIVVYRTNQKHHTDSAYDLLYAIINHDTDYNKVMDSSVYTTDREFRTIYSNKTAEYRPMIPYDRNIDVKSIECLRYMVTYMPIKSYHYLSNPNKNSSYYVINKKTSDNKMLYTSENINKILNLARTIHPSAQYTGQSNNNSGWRFSYTDKNEPCYSGNLHKSNGFYIFNDTSRSIIYMKCMSTNCKGKYILEKKNIKLF